MLGGAILTITRRSAVHSAISLIVSLMGVAGLYLLQQAEFLFAVQIVLYIGGIMVLFLFVIMLVNLDEAAKERQFNGQWLDRASLRGAGGRAGPVRDVEGRGSFQVAQGVMPAADGKGNTEALADVLFSAVPAAVRNRFRAAAGGGGRLGGDGQEEDLTCR